MFPNKGKDNLIVDLLFIKGTTKLTFNCSKVQHTVYLIIRQPNETYYAFY